MKFLIVLAKLGVAVVQYVNKHEAKCTLLIVQHLIAAVLFTFTALIANICSLIS